MRLQPDVVAPGVNVLAAGYGDGEDPRKGFNFLDGTSMSTPIVSGAAAVILQHHTEFTMEEVKSALMTTAEFKGVIRWEDGKPAQPLDMGAGRINLERAIDPDLYISPPKVDFSLAQKPHRYTKTLTVHSYRDKDVTVEVSIVLHSGWNEATPAGNHLKAEPSEFTLSSSKRDTNVTISLDTGSIELGDQNAYVVFTNKMNGKELGHASLWGQITYPEEEKKDILLIIIDKDKCDGTKSEGIVDVYKKTLDEFSLSYDVFEYCQNDGAFSLPERAKGLGTGL